MKDTGKIWLMYFTLHFTCYFRSNPSVVELLKYATLSWVVNSVAIHYP